MSVRDRLAHTFGLARDSREAAALPADRRGVTRRSFTLGSIAAVGAGMAAISLSSCGSSDVKETSGEPQVVDDSQLVGVLDGDYVVAAYQQAYGIDLTDPSLDMHWHRFLALLRGLPGDTVLAEAMRMRGWREDRRSMAAVNEGLRRQWSLPSEQDAATLAWQEAAFGRVAERAR